MTRPTPPTLLHLDASPMGEASVSRALTARFRNALLAAAPECRVVYRDLVAEPVPHLDNDGVMSVYVPAEYRSHGQRRALAAREVLADELLGADAVLLGVPMHNWTVPSHLKAWLDQVLVMGRVLFEPGGPRPLEGRPVTAMLSYGGGYGPDAPLHGWDHVEPYLRTVLVDALGTDLTIVRAELTLFGEGDLAELSAASSQAAQVAAGRRATELAASLSAARAA